MIRIAPVTSSGSGQPLAPIKSRLALTPIAAVIAAGLFSLAPEGAMAATLKVGVNGCTLANAILNANANLDNDGSSGCIAGSGADTITLPTSSTQTRTTALPEITSQITIQGNGSTIKRNPAPRSFASWA